MQIVKDKISQIKQDGTNVDYYVFPEYEIHYNELPPKVNQQWHYHKKIEETIYIIEGEIELHWIEDGKNKVDIVRQGDIVRVEQTKHTFCNSSNKISKFIVFRMVLSGDDKRKIIKNDKYIIQ